MKYKGLHLEKIDRIGQTLSNTKHELNTQNYKNIHLFLEKIEEQLSELRDSISIEHDEWI